MEFDGKARFSETNMSWDGHAWIVYGDWLADVSLFRTADSDKSSPTLKEHVKTGIWSWQRPICLQAWQ